MRFFFPKAVVFHYAPGISDFHITRATVLLSEISDGGAADFHYSRIAF